MSAALDTLLLRVRKQMPPGLRRLLRLAAHARGRGQGSPALPQDLLDDCRLIANRHELVRRLPQQARVLEVGTDRGDFARHILAACNPTSLDIIDLDLSGLDPAVAADPRTTLHRGHSPTLIARFPDAHFDWIYIDADHSHAGVAADAAAAAAKVKPGGHLVFNDFAHADPFLGAYGVHRAVVEFAVEHHWPLAWLAYEGHGLYDVALRRPSVG